MDCVPLIKPSALWKSVFSLYLTKWTFDFSATRRLWVARDYLLYRMCRRIQMRECSLSVVLEFTRFWLCNFCYLNSVLLIPFVEMIASFLSCCLHVIFSDAVICAKDWIFICCVFRQYLTSSRGKRNAKPNTFSLAQCWRTLIVHHDLLKFRHVSIESIIVITCITMMLVNWLQRRSCCCEIWRCSRRQMEYYWRLADRSIFPTWLVNMTSTKLWYSLQCGTLLSSIVLNWRLFLTEKGYF